MQTKSTEQWINLGKKNCRCYLFYQNKVLDLTEFMTEHPGGMKSIKNYIYKDITNILFQVFPHKKQPTLHALMKYQIGEIPEDEAANARSKTDKSVNQNDRPKQKKKVCFNSDKEKMTMPIRPRGDQNKSPMTSQLSRSASHSRQRDNVRESTHKSTGSKSKGKKQELLTSIRVIKEQKGKSYDDYFQENQQKIRQKERAATELNKSRKQRSVLGSCSFEDSELDEDKPNFRVPVLCVKQMNRHH